MQSVVGLDTDISQNDLLRVFILELGNLSQAEQSLLDLCYHDLSNHQNGD